MRPILTYNGYVVGGARAYLLSPNSSVQLGNIIGAIDRPSAGSPGITISGTGHIPTVGVMQRGKIVQWRNTVYVLHNGTVKKLNLDGSWSTVVSLTSAYSDGSFCADFNNQMLLCNINGDYYLAFIYLHSTSSSVSTVLIGATFNLQTEVLSVSTTLTFNAVAPTLTHFSEAIYYNGAIYVIARQSAGTAFVIEYNITSPALSQLTGGITMGASNGPFGAMCIWNNELWLCHYTTGSVPIILRKLVGSSFVSQIANVATDTWAVGATKPCMFTDGTNLYIMAQSSTGPAWKIYSINSSLAVTDITSSVLSSFTGQDVDSRWRIVVDQHLDPTNPEIFMILHGDLRAGTNGFYKWNGPSAAPTFIGSAGLSHTDLAISNPIQGGGEMMYTVGEPHIQIEGPLQSTTIPGNTRVSYRIYESTLVPSGTPCTVGLFFNRAQLETPTTTCRLTNPSVGSMLNDYTIQNVPAGSGTLYTVDWRAAADGVSTGEGVLLVAQVSGVI